MTITNKVSNKTLMPGITPVADVPDAPTIGTVTVTNSTTVSVPFTAATTGGAPTSYVVAATPTVGNISTNAGTSSPRTATGTFDVGTAYTFTIRGVNSTATGPVSSASNSVTPFTFSATGGQETQTIGASKYHIFNASGSLIVSGSKNIDVLVIGAGGGGGGSGGRGSGGGGAGAVEGFTTVSATTNTYTITIGAGGSGGGIIGLRGGNGGTSTGATGLTAAGGGAGGGVASGERTGNTGGSGGGSSFNASAGGAGGSRTNAGGVGNTDEYDGLGGGGGGAGSAGASPGGGGSGIGLGSIDANLTAANFPSTLTGKTTVATGGSGGTNLQGGSPSTPASPTLYGSGGSGGIRGNNNDADGASGSAGLVIVRYTV